MRRKFTEQDYCNMAYVIAALSVVISCLSIILSLR